MAGEELKDLVKTEVQPLTGGDVLHKPVAELTQREAVEAFVILKFVEDKAEERHEELRGRLLAEAEQKGVLDEENKGHRILNVDGTEVIREKHTKTKPDEKKLRELLLAKGLSVSSAFDTKMVPVEEANVSKLQALVKLGKISQEEFDALFPPTFHLKVKESEELKTILLLAAQRFEQEKHAGVKVLTEGKKGSGTASQSKTKAKK